MSIECNIVDTHFHTSSRTGTNRTKHGGFSYCMKGETCRKTVEIRILSLRHCIFFTEMRVVNNAQCVGWPQAMLCSSLWDFVHEKCETRYSGHLVSRLAVSGHNITKQTRFPTTWRESWKSTQNKWLLKVMSDVCLTMATTFVLIWGWPRKNTLLSSRPQTVGKTGWSWTELWISLSIRLNWLGIASGQAVLGARF
jgi:hypothetical protein